MTSLPVRYWWPFGFVWLLPEMPSSRAVFDLNNRKSGVNRQLPFYQFPKNSEMCRVGSLFIKPWQYTLHISELKYAHTRHWILDLDTLLAENLNCKTSCEVMEVDKQPRFKSDKSMHVELIVKNEDVITHGCSSSVAFALGMERVRTLYQSRDPNPMQPTCSKANGTLC